jgi:peptide/nickel transport system permease protein
VLAATHRGRFLDAGVTLGATLGMAIPNFWQGLVLMYLFAVLIPILPAARMGGPANYVLPVITLSSFTLAAVTRLLRSSMTEVLDSEYAKLARIKGVSANGVIWKHCLRNALGTVLHYSALQIAALITGTIVVETVFAWPGVGRLLFEAVMGRDYPLVQGIVTIKATFIIIMNLVADIMHAYLDPRIRLR